jgi:hypothetical protein
MVAMTELVDRLGLERPAIEAGGVSLQVEARTRK